MYRYIVAERKEGPVRYFMKLGKIIKRFKSKKGDRVIVRYPAWEDLDDLLSFVNELSQEDTFVLLSGEKISRGEEITYLTNVISGMEKGERIHLVATVNGAFAANCGITRLSRRKKHVGEINISVAKPFRQMGIGAQLMISLIREAKIYGLRLLTLSCLENNARALHLYEKLGFRRVGVTPGAISYKGEYVGEVHMFLPLIPARPSDSPNRGGMAGQEINRSK